MNDMILKIPFKPGTVVYNVMLGSLQGGEEVGDVLLMIDCLSGITNMAAVQDSARRKIKRWHERTFGDGHGE